MDNIFHYIYHEILSDRDISIVIDDAILQIRSNVNTYSPMWHALGFIHCKLFEFEKGTLRIHIWPKNVRDNTEQEHKIHDHIFSLKSCVICGEIANRNYKLTKAHESNDSSLELYRVKYHKDGSSLLPSGEYYQAFTTETISVKRKKIYSVERGTFHTSSVEESNFVVTLVVTYDHKNDDPKMLGRFTSEGNIFRARVSYPLDEWDYLLSEVSLNKC